MPDGAGGWVRATNLLGIAADPLTTSLDDLTRWLLALRSGEIGGVPVTAAMAEPTRLRDGTPVHYGLGLAVRRYRGLTVLCHSGSQPGYKAHIAVCARAGRRAGDPVQPGRRAPDDIRDRDHGLRAIGDFPAPHPARAARRRFEAAGFTPEQTRAVEGVYVDRDAGEWVSLSLEDGVLRGETLGDPVFLYHEQGGVFRDGDDLPGDRSGRAPPRGRPRRR